MLEITPKQENILSEFRELVADLEQNDATLLRFLKARNYNLIAAEQMLRKCMDWRDLNDIDNSAEWTIPQKLLQGYPYEITGKDVDGNIVFYVPVGKWTIRQLFDAGYLEESFRFLYQIIEWGAKESDKTGVKFTLILDFQGMDYWMISHYQSVQGAVRLIREYESSFPELLHTALIINVPSIFSWVWPVISKAFTGTTLSKIHLLGNTEVQYVPELLKHIPLKTLPKFLSEKSKKFLV